MVIRATLEVRLRNRLVDGSASWPARSRLRLRIHFDAVATQRLMACRPGLRVARFADVQLFALALQDEQRAREFVARTLGQLADADPELRDTLCVYIGEQFSAES